MPEKVGTRLQMPFLLQCGMGLSMFYACAALFIFVAFAVMAPFGGGSYSIGGHAVSRAEFVARAWPLIVMWPIASGIIIAIAYALWRELPWSRPAMMTYVFVVAVFSIAAAMWGGDRDGVAVASFACVVMLLGANWYLYWKRSVVAYYAAVADRHSSWHAD